MAKRKRKKKTAEELDAENELLKLKLMAEFGGNFMGGGKIPPDIENQFLKQVANFHKQQGKSVMTTVYKFIGEPEYNHVRDLNEKEIAKELKRLLKLMDKKGVSLAVLAATPEKEIYRFVTEELFKEPVEDLKLKGWVNQFVYEDFYPNPEYDVKAMAFYCLESVFNKGKAFAEDIYSEEMKDAIGLSMDTDELEGKIVNFWSQFYNIKLEKYDVEKVKIDKEAGEAHAVCKVFYKVQKGKGKRFKTETTIVELNLEKSKVMDTWWEIKQVICDLL